MLEALHRFAGCAPAQGQDDSAVFERRRQATDEGDHARAPGREEPWLVARGADDESGGAGVAGVDDAPQGQIVQEERVGLIHDKRGGELLDGPVEGSDRDIGRGKRALGQRGRQLFRCRLAAALKGRAERENRGHVERLEGVGEDDPEGQRLGAAIRQADETAVGASEFVK